MVYELYVDSLFLVNFVMNLYLLMLVNRKLMRTATRVRILLGAGAGAIAYLLVFFIRAPVWIKWPVTFLAGTGLMLEVTFRPQTFRAFLRILRQLCQYSFLIGGMLLFVSSAIPVMRQYMTQIGGVLGVGAISLFAVGYFQENARNRRNDAVCKARLINEDASISVTALVDSGNSLAEPVSGKPVSIINASIFKKLWGEEQPPFRAIPYHSIGRKHGILQGYLLPELEVEIEGMKSCFRDVYVAVCEEEFAEGMILNPQVLEKSDKKKGNDKENDF